MVLQGKRWNSDQWDTLSEIPLDGPPGGFLDLWTWKGGYRSLRACNINAWGNECWETNVDPPTSQCPDVYAQIPGIPLSDFLKSLPNGPPPPIELPSLSDISSSVLQIELSSASWVFQCPAAYLGGQIAVTAKHCVDGLSASSLRVKGGTTLLSGSGQTSEILGYVIPDDADLAILNLAQPFVVGQDLSRAMLPLSNGSDFADQSCTTVGWGPTAASNTLPDSLQINTMTALSTAEANNILAPIPGDWVSENQLAMYDWAQEVSMSRGGGGLVYCPLNDGYVLAGIYSWGVESNGITLASYPAIATRLSSFRGWIEENLP
jgi:trypsin